MVLGWAFVHGAAKLRAAEEATPAEAPVPVPEYDPVMTTNEPTAEHVRSLVHQA